MFKTWIRIKFLKADPGSGSASKWNGFSALVLVDIFLLESESRKHIYCGLGLSTWAEYVLKDNKIYLWKTIVSKKYLRGGRVGKTTNLKTHNCNISKSFLVLFNYLIINGNSKYNNKIKASFPSSIWFDITKSKLESGLIGLNSDHSTFWQE